MRKAVAILIVAIILGFAGYVLWDPQGEVALPAPDTAQEAEARAFVEEFGEKLQLVTLTGEAAVANPAMRAQYGPYVSEVLLETWIENKTIAPGRLTSSPYPDRIETQSATCEGAVCRVEGEVVEETSTGESGRTHVTVTVSRDAERLVITGYSALPAR